MADQLARGGGGLVEVDGALVGFILWKEEEGALYLSRLAVRPGYRRRGIARALIDGAEREASRRGLSAMTLGVRRELDDNGRLFESCGFVETGPTYHEGFVEPTGVRMERRLGNR
jgi:ribosomal protein S18 acetylase RimI-like enzyme